MSCYRLPNLAGFFVVITLTACSGGSGSSGNPGPDPDRIPDGFSFPSRGEVAVSSAVTSATIPIVGIDAPASITVSGGQYSIGCNLGAFTADAGVITNGQSVCLRHISAATGSTQTSTTLTIGGVSAVFQSTTRADDSSPDDFSFAPVSNAAISSLLTSTSVTVGGINTEVPVSIVGGEYSIACSPTNFTADNGTIHDGQSICVRHTSAPTGSTKTQTALSIGDVTATFESTTRPDDTAPEPFGLGSRENVDMDTFIVSDTATIRGIDAPSPISVSDGEYSIGCSSSFVSTPATIYPGQTVCVRHRSAITGSTTTTTTLNVGGYTASFSSKTRPSDDYPDDLRFPTAAGVEYFRSVDSDAIAITGINVPVSISVIDGEYSLGCNGEFTNRSGTARNGDTVCLRHISSSLEADEVTTTLVVGRNSGSFVSRTKATYLIPYFVGDQLFGYDAGLQQAILLDSPGDNGFYSRVLYSITMASGIGQASAVRPAHVVYAKGGKIYRVGLATGQSHLPQTVSTLTDVCHVVNRLSDFANPLNSWVIAYQDGGHGDCRTIANAPVAVRASYSDAVPGVQLPPADGQNQSLAAIHSPDGSIASIISTERNPTSELRRYDGDLTNSTRVLKLDSPGFWFQRELWSSSIYFSALIPDLGQALMRYDESSRSATVLKVFPQGLWNTIEFDTNNAYVADQRSLYRIPHSAMDESQVEVLRTFGEDSDSYAILGLAATDDGQLVCSVKSLDSAGAHSPEQGVWSFISAGANTGIQVVDSPFELVATLGNLLYVNRPLSNSLTEARQYFSTGGAADALSGATWLRRTILPGGFPLSPAGFQDLDLTGKTAGDRLMLRADAISTGVIEIAVFDGTNGMQLRSVGRLAVGREQGEISGYGPLTVLVWIPPAGDAESAEVYAFDTRRGNSLLRVTP